MKEPDYEVQNAIGALGMARAGIGVTVLPRLSLSGLNMSGLKALTVCEPRLERSLGIISRADRPLAPPAAAYVDLLALEVARAGHTRRSAPSRPA
jgi:DNA-binding transcriptional LysR family regulator